MSVIVVKILSWKIKYSLRNRDSKIRRKFLTWNIFGRKGPIFSGNELDLTIHKSYICAKFQDDMMIFTPVIVRQRKLYLFL